MKVEYLVLFYRAVFVGIRLFGYKFIFVFHLFFWRGNHFFKEMSVDIFL